MSVRCRMSKKVDNAKTSVSPPEHGAAALQPCKVS